jgi:hypothetical protein
MGALRPATRPPGAALTWLYLGLSAVTIAMIVPTHLVEYSEDTAFLWTTIRVVDPAFALARIVVALMWLHKTWQDVSTELRESVGVTPGKAVGYLFVPFLNFYWIFAMHRRLCTSLERMRIDAGGLRQAPFALATLAPIAHLVHSVVAKLATGLPVLVSYAAASALWTVYMFACDGVRGELRAKGRLGLSA